MGNSAGGAALTADAAPLSLDAVMQLSPPRDTNIPADLQWNLKVWRFRCDDRQHTNWSVGTAVRLLPELPAAEPSCSYLLAVVRRRKCQPAAASGCAAAAASALQLREVVTPRGLRAPVSLQFDWFGKQVREGRGPCTLHTLYLYHGCTAAPFTRAHAFRRALELERMLTERWWLSDALMVAGQPGVIAPAASRVFFHQLGTPREQPDVHLLRLLALAPDGIAPQPNGSAAESRKRLHDEAVDNGTQRSARHADPTAGLSRSGRRRDPHTDRSHRSHRSREHDQEEVPDERKEEQRQRDKLLAWSPLASDVESYLAVSGQVPAESLEKLLNARITHVLNTVDMLVDCKFPEHIHYVPMRMMDSMNENISTFFPHAIALIERVRNMQGGKLLVHCMQGASRSCTLICAYLMWRDGMTHDEAIEYLRGRRGIAKPNLGFYTRLMLWGRHLRDPPTVQIYRLTWFSPDCMVPLVLALEQCGEKEVPACLDPRTAYLVTTLGRPGAQNEARAAWIWRGAECDETLLRAARDLTPEVLMYAFRTSLCAGPTPIKWPPEWTAAPTGVPIVEQGAEPPALAAVLRDGGAVGPPQRVQKYDDCYGQAQYLAAKWVEWCADQRRQESAEADRARARGVDLIHLRSVNQGGHSQRAATPRLRSERLDVSGLWIRKGNEFAPHVSYCTSGGFDEDEFEAFQESHADQVCVFVKWRGDLRLVDVWIGSKHPYCREGAAGCAEQVRAAFRDWLAAPSGPAWGADAAQGLVWDAIEHFWVADGQDDAKDVRFFGRWVRD
eukprot:TRINITY_DN55282_c0_g1_i1.p1 TRINITY_DN55282_c0_g1~~TRINITY_DN55282_c0_g1_i1.p1  ORF type:complete len:811 (+),score=210.32 TRINITY_DN55282_c0_g1_i1:79-2433(+)